VTIGTEAAACGHPRFSYARADRHPRRGLIVLLAGGIGRATSEAILAG
jgi:hypothetical protein